MKQLPVGWTTARLAELTSDCEQRVPTDTESFVYIDISSVDRESKTIHGPQELVGAKAPSRARKVVRTGDVLVSMTRPNLNAVALIPPTLDRQIASTGFDVLRSTGVDPRWLFYAVRTQSFVAAMSDLVQGALYPAIRSRDVRAFKVPVAPLPEQIRVAEKVDALLERVNACRECLDRVPEILKRFRQSVMSAAISGELTRDWRLGRKLTFDWPQRRLGTLVLLKTGPFGSSLHRSDYTPNGVPVVNPMHIADGRIRPGDRARVSANVVKRLREFRLEIDDVVMGRRGEMGRCAVVRPHEAGWLCGTGSLILRPGPEVDARFLQLFMASPSTVALLEGKSVGSTMVNLNQGILKSIPLRLPSLQEQVEVARRVDRALTWCAQLEDRIAKTSDIVPTLTSAVLAKAFRGELVPQDPSDEPAEEMLARVRASKQSPAKAPTRKKPMSAGA